MSKKKHKKKKTASERKQSISETRELVEELKKREGVEAHIAEPYEDLTVTVNGPAVVLVVTD